MIKDWESWLNESYGTPFKCYGHTLLSLSDFMKQENLNDMILLSLKNTRESTGEDIDEDDLEYYRKNLLRDFKHLAASLGSDLKNVYVLNFEKNFTSEMFYPVTEKGEILSKDADLLKFWYDFADVNGPYPSRDSGTKWLNARLVKPNKNPQTHVIHIHFPWSDIEDEAIIAKKETFEILEVLSSIKYDKSSAFLPDMIKKVDPVNLKDQFRIGIASKKYDL